ncbi:MAG: ABC transporter permease [Oscillospiraceae bacterium]
MSGFFSFFAGYYPKLLTALWQHLALVAVTMVLSLALAAAITLAVLRFPRFSELMVGLLGAVYSIPSLALFALMIPLTGLGNTTAVIVMVVYNQFLLLRNFLTGLRTVDSTVIEAATGMGMSPLQRLIRVQIPLAFPVLLAGVHLAMISTIGIANIAATINAGGLGVILFDGLRTQNTYKIVWGALFAAGLALLANLLMGAIERYAKRRLGPVEAETAQ